jgi:hypothetical protein
MEGDMESDRLVHGLIVERLRRKLGRDYKEVRVNPGGGPDLVLGSHGLTLAVLQVETEGSITPEGAERWAGLAASGQRLILMVPRASKVRATELLWEKGIMDRVALGTYEIVINMP